MNTHPQTDPAADPDPASMAQEDDSPVASASTDSGNGLGGWLRGLMRRLGSGRQDEEGFHESLEGLFEEYREVLEDLSLGADEMRMVFNIIRNGDLRCEEIMVPRADVVAIDAEASLADVLGKFSDSGHSRMPIYRGKLDDVMGMVHVKDTLQLVGDDAAEGKFAAAEGGLESIRRPVLFVAPSKRAMELLKNMRASRTHMAIVVDEYGGTDGLVTIEDLVEQIVGEIEDEHDASEPDMIRALGPTRFDVDARLPVADMEEALGISLTADKGEDVDTVGGLVFSLAGRVPQIGEKIRHASGVRFEVVNADPRRISRLRVTATRAATQSDAAETADRQRDE